ncbi:Uncharacterized protein TCM_030916 [Theobroma cacao]|uniref:MULE transposase domain-containing protein n=1 Tax=Theobroma cacao TaxID=3641 RepID=A0A061F5R6_THECC|nr:Uncharacterized protein TCM_030916 [Theobroma cacao]
MQRSSETVECIMHLLNENTTLEDNNVRLEGDTTTLEDNTAFDEENEDLFSAGEDRFDDTSNDGLEQWQDDNLDDDCLCDSDIPICNNVEGKTEPVGGAERFSFQTITTKESTCAEDRLYKGKMFSSKAELKRALNMLVIKEKFAIRVKMSCKARYEVGCKDKACKFSVRATKLLDIGEYWQVRTFHKVHTCTVDGLQGRFSTTSAKMIGELMSHKLQANGVALRPKDIICEMRVQWGLECLYVTVVATNEEERFKYCFWSYGACIRGFKDVMRPTVAIDATHLKGKFKGVLFVAVSKDANKCVYPVALGIDHVKDEDSWTWFLSKLRDAVGCPENTMFISDQHLDIKKAIQNAYPEAHHGLCGYHLKKNFKNKFKRDDVCMLFTLVRDCYKVADFNRHMNQLQQIHSRAHADLMRIGLEKWARACSPARRYQMMTSNIAKCVNSCLKHARQMPITVLIEFIRDMFQHWFHDRYEEAVKVTTPFSLWVAK